MRLTDEEKAMLDGDMGSHVQWAIDHQIKIGNFFDAADMVPVSQAHMMADPEAFGAAGAAFMEAIASRRGVRLTPSCWPRSISFSRTPGAISPAVIAAVKTYRIRDVADKFAP